MITLIILSLFVCASALRISMSPDVLVPSEVVERMSTFLPQQDGPLSDAVFDELSFNSTSFARRQQMYTYDDSRLCRLAMRKKIAALGNPRVRWMSKADFKTLSKDKLPSDGAVIFAIDDPFHSSDRSTYCPPQEILDDPRLLGVAAEDAMCNHSKVSMLPIGMESMLITGAHPRNQKDLDTFMKLVQNPLPANQRKYKVNSDAQLHVFSRPKSGYRNDRRAMIDGVQLSAIDDWHTRHIEFKSHLVNHAAQAQLALCPEGNGMDAHRFYHYYALRTRCIVRKGIISDMHSHFPGTIVVDDWHDVTAENIEKWIAEVPATYDPDLLTSKFWINKFLKPHGISPLVE